MPIQLTTAQGEALLQSNETPWTVYPRPQMRRNSYVNLNGAWDLHVNYENQGKIRVPFCPESRLSAIGQHYEEGSLLSYSREFILPEGFNRGRVILHIGAADQRAEVFLNNKPVGSHKGGYEAFSFDITALLLKTRVSWSQAPRGGQFAERLECGKQRAGFPFRPWLSCFLVYPVLGTKPWPSLSFSKLAAF